MTRILAPRFEQISVSVANIKSNPLMALTHVRADMDLVAKPAPDLVLAQEIQPISYKQLFRAAFKGWRLAGMRRECPIAYPTRWTLVRAWSKRRHLGVPKITPNRYDVLVKAVLPSGLKVCVIDTHMVSRWCQHAVCREVVAER